MRGKIKVLRRRGEGQGEEGEGQRHERGRTRGGKSDLKREKNEREVTMKLKKEILLANRGKQTRGEENEEKMHARKETKNGLGQARKLIKTKNLRHKYTKKRKIHKYKTTR